MHSTPTIVSFMLLVFLSGCGEKGQPQPPQPVQQSAQKVPPAQEQKVFQYTVQDWTKEVRGNVRSTYEQVRVLQQAADKKFAGATIELTGHIYRIGHGFHSGDRPNADWFVIWDGDSQAMSTTTTCLTNESALWLKTAEGGKITLRGQLMNSSDLKDCQIIKYEGETATPQFTVQTFAEQYDRDKAYFDFNDGHRQILLKGVVESIAPPKGILSRTLFLKGPEGKTVECSIDARGGRVAKVSPGDSIVLLGFAIINSGRPEMIDCFLLMNE